MHRHILLLLLAACGQQESSPPASEPTPPPVFYVDELGECGGRTPCFTHIHDAILAAEPPHSSTATDPVFDPNAPRAQVIVGPGTYSRDETVPIVMSWFPVDITAEAGPESTIISGANGSSPCIAFTDGAQTKFSGFTITACRTAEENIVNDQYVIYIDSYKNTDLLITGNVITNNAASGYAVAWTPYYVNYSDVTIRIVGNIIRNNHGGVYVELTSAYADERQSANVLIGDNLIVHNQHPNASGFDGAGIYFFPWSYETASVRVQIVFNTLVDNTAGLAVSQCRLHVANNLAANNGTNDLRDQNPNGNTYVANWLGTGSAPAGQSGAPGFVDAAHDDFHLTATSSALDLGLAGETYALTVDLDGQPRGAGQPDAGAYERQ